MDTEDDHQRPESRLPTVDDLLLVCRKLNEAGAKYVVVGGMAIIQAGYARQTEDIDLLIENSQHNIGKVKEALLTLPDGAIEALQEDDLQKYVVVRVADEFIVDLMLKACGIDFDEAEPDIEFVDVRGVTIPFAKPELLWRLKQTMREKDNLDLLFLNELLKNRK